MNNSDLFGKAYIYLKNKYLMPLISSTVEIDKAQYWTIKEILNRQLGYPIEIRNSGFKIRLAKECYYKSLIAQINLFQTKISAQIKNCDNDLSPNWQFVTRYYSFFLSGMTFLLFQHQGLTYLYDDTLRMVEAIFIVYNLNPSCIKLQKGDYLFTEEIVEGNDVIVSFSLETKTGGSHVHLWNRIYIIMNQLLKICDSKEKKIYDVIHTLCNRDLFFVPSFPSETRNHFNYTPESAINDYQNKITFIDNVDDKFISNFVRFIPDKDDDFL